MNYKDLIKQLELCPICNTVMSSDLLDIAQRAAQFIISLSCVNHKEFYIENYCVENIDNVNILSMSIHFETYSVSWVNLYKKFYLRSPDGIILFSKIFPDTRSVDWITSPYKNIIDKSKSIMLLI